MILTKEEHATAVTHIVETCDTTADNLEYIDAVMCPWKNEKAMVATFHDTEFKTTRSAQLYWY